MTAPATRKRPRRKRPKTRITAPPKHFPTTLYVTIDQPDPADQASACLLANENYDGEHDGARVAVYELTAIKIVHVGGARLEDK